MVAPGGHAWLLPGGVMHGCSQGGSCMIALGGMCGCSWGGMHGCSGGACVVARGVCVVAQGGYAWLLWGGVHGIQRDTEIWSMSRQYASYWNAFLFSKFSSTSSATRCLPYISKGVNFFTNQMKLAIFASVAFLHENKKICIKILPLVRIDLRISAVPV